MLPFIEYQQDIIRKLLVYHARRHGYELREIIISDWNDYRSKKFKTYLRINGRYDNKYFHCIIDPEEAFDEVMYDEMFADMKYRDERGWLEDD